MRVSPMQIPRIISLHLSLAIALILSTIFVDKAGFTDPDDPNRFSGAPERYVDAPSVIIDPNRVPVEFRHLISLAMEWSIGDEVQLDRYIRNAPEGKKRELVAAFEPHMNALSRWIVNNSNTIPQPDEVVLFDVARNAVEVVQSYLREDQ